MFDFNLIIQEAEKMTGFWFFSQNWFDILSLVLTILSLWLAYYLGERGYRRDKKDKEKDQKELIKSEVKLFENNLGQLNLAIDGQLKGLKKYKKGQNFSLEFNPDVQVDFLKFIDVKHIYEAIGFKKEDGIEKVNSLFAALYSLNDFRHSLRDSVRTYISRYTTLEKRFYLYRKLMYRMFHEISNRRAIDVIRSPQGFQINFGHNEFAERYFHHVQAVLSNPDLLNESQVVIREKLIELFIMPLIEITKQYIPVDEDAIEVSDVTNEVNAAWIDMETVTRAHFEEIEGHINSLEKVKTEIITFLDLNK
ncbi:hypothetical protein [Aquimarina algiphila]|uniref:hypothetical protein n=1 Tax=Aquimarina algiphila TaxID=2047982 RepID=UPI002330748D|nr:hypothetical protein [Aquimarina algiphila]